MNQIFIICAILFSVFSAIRPFKIWKLPVNIVTGPLLALIALLLAGIITPEIIVSGIKGNNNLKPWEIILIFYTTAYISISVDLSGILDFFAFKIVRIAKGNGIILFIFFYTFSSILTIFTSNDIVILTLTPIIFYCNKHARINVIPLLFAEFFGANTLSMLLYIGNPTNIIIGNALGLGFSEYTRIMVLPTLTATIVNIIMLFIVFNKQITRKYELTIDSNTKIRSMYDAGVSTLMLLIMLTTLLFSQKLHVPIYVITVFFASLYILEDLIVGLLYTIKHYKLYITEISVDLRKIFSLYGFEGHRHDFFIIIKRLPWKILIFIIVIFIFVSGLSSYGFITSVALLIKNLSNTVVNGILVNGTLSFLLANVINNQPMTIFYSSILTDPAFIVDSKIFTTIAYSVIIASNLGANFTIIGALAGLMWEKILRSKGIIITYKRFFITGLLITPVVFFTTLFVLYLVVR